LSKHHDKSYPIKERRGRRKSINLATVSANNHYAGFDTGTASIFRKMVGLPKAAYIVSRKSRTRRRKMTNLTFIIVVVTSSSSIIIQSKVPFQML
jgi:galactokinase